MSHIDESCHTCKRHVTYRMTERFNYLSISDRKIYIILSICDQKVSLFVYMWHDEASIRVAWLIYTWRDSCIRVIWISLNTDSSFSENDKTVTWRFHICDMTHLYVCHDASLCVTWLVYTSDMSLGRLLKIIYVTWLIYIFDMTRASANMTERWHDVSIFVTWHMYTCGMMRHCVWHDSLLCVTWLIYVWRD